MIRVKTKFFKKGSDKLGIPRGGGVMFLLNYRKGVMYFTKYPDRSKYTSCPFLKKCYALDDQLEFFDATNLKNFKQAQNTLIDDILTLANKCYEEADKYPQGTNPNIIYTKRAICLELWAESLFFVKARWPLQNSIKRLKSKRLKLK